MSTLSSRMLGATPGVGWHRGPISSGGKVLDDMASLACGHAIGAPPTGDGSLHVCVDARGRFMGDLFVKIGSTGPRHVDNDPPRGRCQRINPVKCRVGAKKIQISRLERIGAY